MHIRNTVGGFVAAAVICWGQGAQASTQDLKLSAGLKCSVRFRKGKK